MQLPARLLSAAEFRRAIGHLPRQKELQFMLKTICCCVAHVHKTIQAQIFLLVTSITQIYILFY